MELERNRISFILFDASMTFPRKSSLRSHLTAEVAEFFSQALKKKKNHWITSKGSSTEKRPCKPLCGQCQPTLLIHSSLEIVLARRRSTVLANTKSGAELRSADALKELFNLPSMRLGEGLEEYHDGISHVFGCLCGVCTQGVCAVLTLRSSIKLPAA